MIPNSKVLCVIPSRIGSKRFPKKPLAKILGKPMIEWVYRRVSGTGYPTVVATDSEEIAKAVRNVGGEALFTSEVHLNGTERAFEAAALKAKQTGVKPELVVNVQGDEPLLKSEIIAHLIATFNPGKHKILTPCTPMVVQSEVLVNKNASTVARNLAGEALYFSRLMLPYHVDGVYPQSKLRHLGIYLYGADTLEKLVKLPKSSLEAAESLEQNRWLENGFNVHLEEVLFDAPSVDLPEEIAEVEAFLDLNKDYQI